MKLFRGGVIGRSARASFWWERMCRGGGGGGAGIFSRLSPWEEGNKLVRKLDIAGNEGECE